MTRPAVVSPFPATPRAWLDTALPEHFDRWAEGDERDRDESVWFTAAELYADHHALLRHLHRRTQRDGAVPARAAAMFVAGWIGGCVSEAVAFALVDARAGWVIDDAQLRWRLHPAGWVDAVALQRVPSCEPRMLVGPQHPWADVNGVDVVDGDELVQTTMHALANALDPLVDACSGLARVARSGLWNEVVDAFGMTLAFDRRHDPDQAAIELLEHAMHSVRGRWRARPSLRVVHAPAIAPASVVIGQKGGCCLSYTRDRSTMDYCSTCSLREADDVCERQLRWHATRPTT